MNLYCVRRLAFIHTSKCFCLKLPRKCSLNQCPEICLYARKIIHMCDTADMQFHNYLESLLGSRVSIRLVRTLINYAGKIFTVRKLAEAAGVSSSEAALAVQELEKFGIIKIQPVGRSYLISLNNKSY